MSSKVRTNIIMSIFLTSLICMLGYASAVTLDLGLNMTATGGQSVYIDTIPIVVDQLWIGANSVEMTNPSWQNGNLIVNYTGLINWTSGNIKSSQFPRFTTDSNTDKTFASSLPALSASYTFNVESCESIGNIKHGSTLYQKGDYTCSDNRVTIDLVNVADGDTLTIEYGCSTSTRISFNLIMLLTAIAIIAFIMYFVYNRGIGNMTLGDFFIVATGVITSVVFWMVAGQNLGSACPVG